MLLLSSMVQNIFGLYLEHKGVEKYRKIWEENVKHYKEKHDDDKNSWAW